MRLKDRIAVVTGGIVFSCASIFAQQPTPQPTPAPTPVWSREREVQKQITADQVKQGNQNRRQSTLGGEDRRVELRKQAARMTIAKLYRKSTDEELAALAPDSELLRKYADFLKLSGTGLLRLAPNLGCVNDNMVVGASEECLKYTMPGGGNSYSFRTGDYRIRRLADITLSQDRFDVSGQLSHGILVNLGDADIKTAGLRSGGMAFLVNFKPVTDMAMAQQIQGQFLRGIESGGFYYRSSLEAVVNSTYVLRSIAYDGDYYRTLDGALYDEFNFDRRSDVIVALRVIEKRSDGGVTILWKELSRKKAPRMKLLQEPEPRNVKD